ncbi:hypothetical protein ACHWQZ_G010350 [Mnemiopsis leidyi]
MAEKETYFFRATDMTMVEMFLSQECAYECVKELGELGHVQFVDLEKGTNLFQRSFVPELKRADEMERRLRYLAAEINAEGIRVPIEYEIPPAPNSTATESDLETMIATLEDELKEVKKNLTALRTSYVDLMELKQTLIAADVFFRKGSGSLWSVPTNSYSLEEGDEGGRLHFITGVIDREKVGIFERVIWRSCRGNVFVKTVEIKDEMTDPNSGELVEKNVFICFFQGNQLEQRVKKICDGMSCRVYPCSEKNSRRQEVRSQVSTRLAEMEDVIAQTQEHRTQQLKDIAVDIRNWIVKVKKWRSIYYTMSKFNVNDTRTGFIAEGWVRTCDLDNVKQALKRGATTSGSVVMPILNTVGSSLPPPTYHPANKITKGYQVIIDAYGVATYQEINPAIFTVITFPFLFGIMFGDMAHGLFLFLFGAWFIYKESYFDLRKHLLDEIISMLYHGRYIILMMGIFASYSGLLYNEIYSKGLDIFGSSWRMPNDDQTYTSSDSVTLDPKYDYGPPYYYGIDPMWILSENKLTYLNSYKMKLSVILGLSQMTFGLFISLLNYRYFGRVLDIWFTFIPQLIFLECIIGYMCFLIFYKWFFVDAGKSNPSILITMIDMFLSVGSGIDSDDKFYEGQELVQLCLVIIALCMVPIMFAAKPLIEKYHRSKDSADYEALSYDSDDEDLEEREKAEEAAELDTWVNQGIHTIEFCLGVISNTASYLRLWALSLAHSELSEVLWDMTMYYAFEWLDWDEGSNSRTNFTMAMATNFFPSPLTSYWKMKKI